MSKERITVRVHQHFPLKVGEELRIRNGNGLIVEKVTILNGPRTGEGDQDHKLFGALHEKY